MRIVLKKRLEQRFFQRKLHVTALSCNSEGKGVPFYYQGKLFSYEVTHRWHKEKKADIYGEFIIDTENVDIIDTENVEPTVVYCPLDGLHREFAMLDIIASDGRDDCKVMLDTPFSLSVYSPATTEPLNNEDSERFAAMMRILSKIIAENANLSLNSTLCDAVSSIACIEEFAYLSSFLLSTKDIEAEKKQIVKLRFKDQKVECLKRNPFIQTVNMFKALCKSEDFLTLFKSKWKAKYKKNSDFKEDFWKDGEGSFSSNENLKLFFIKSYEMGGHYFLKHITNESPNYAVEDKKEMGIEYACYSVARAIEPLFFCEDYKDSLIVCIDRLTTSGLITIHRLSFMSTLAYEVSNMIVEEFYRYSDFLSGNKDQTDHVLKFENQRVTTKARKGIAQRILFNFILTKIWYAYSTWRQIFKLEDEKLKLLEERFRDLDDSIIKETTADTKEKYNLGLDMVDLLHPDNPKFNEQEKCEF